MSDKNQVARDQKVLRERVLFWVLLGGFVFFGCIEWAIIATVQELSPSTSVLFFVVLNVNVIIAICLVFLSIRHLMRFFFGHHGRLLDKSLKMKLSLIFLAFSILPTLLIFFVSFFYIRSSFDQWFKRQVIERVNDSVDLTVYTYDVTRKMLSREAELFRRRLIELPKGDERCLSLNETLIHAEWGVVLEKSGRVLCQWKREGVPDDLGLIVSEIVKTDDDMVQLGGGQYMYTEFRLASGVVSYIGVLLPKAYVEKMAKVAAFSQNLKNLNPYATPIKSIYTVVLIAMTALVLFSSIWIGIHVSDRLTKPLNELTQTMSLVRDGVFKRIPLQKGEQVEVKVVKESYNRMIAKWEETRKQLEAALADVKSANFDVAVQKKFIELVLNDLDSAIVLFDEKNNIAFHNRAFFRQFIKPERMPAKLPTVLQNLLLVLVQKSNERSRGVDERVVKEITLSGGNRTYEIVLRTLGLKDAGGRMFLAIFHDLTDVQTEQTLMAWQEVAKRVAHEVKNPLTPIQLLSERLQRKLQKEGVVDPEDLRETLTSTLHHVEHIKNLVSEFSKVSDLPSVTPTLGGVFALIEKIQEVYEPLCAQHRVAFEVSVEPQTPPFPYDFRAMMQVFQNLIQNSIQAMQGGSVRNLFIRLSVKYNRRLRTVIFVLEDNGPGIDAGVVSRIFSPNFTTKEKGMGLGLSISKRIVENHGGRIQVLSGVEVGTRFMIEMPVYRQFVRVASRKQETLAI